MKSTRQYRRKSQLDKANDVLLALAPDITADDKKLAAKKCKVSRYTVNSSLKGLAKDLGIAMQLIRFFKGVVEERDRELMAAAA